MDATRFDRLAKSLSADSTRRGIMQLLASLPLVGGLAALVGADEAAAKGRRKRRKKRHKHGKGRHKGKHKHHKKKCKPNSQTKTCAGKCGQIKNNCKKTVDCGSCACDPPCPACQICDETTGTCVSDTVSVDDVCDTCHICDASGQCVAVADDTPCDDENACTQVDTCQAGVCVGSNPVACQPLDQCHDAGTCDPDTGACSNPPKPDGDPCDDGNACTQTDTCQRGVCTGNPVVCNACQLCNPDSGCIPDPAKQHTCDGPCPSGEWCDAGACADIQATITFPDCHSLCDGSTEVCGQTVTCPSCVLCIDQTGCFSNVLPEGPVGSGQYCSASGATSADVCTTNADCDPGRYCADTGATDFCAIICPF